MVEPASSVPLRLVRLATGPFTLIALPPEGTFVAASDPSGQLFAFEPGAAAIQLSTVTMAVAAGAGERLFFRANDGLAVYQRGQGMRRGTGVAGTVVDVSPDGSRIILVTAQGDFYYGEVGALEPLPSPTYSARFTPRSGHLYFTSASQGVPTGYRIPAGQSVAHAEVQCSDCGIQDLRGDGTLVALTSKLRVAIASTATAGSPITTLYTYPQGVQTTGGVWFRADLPKLIVERSTGFSDPTYEFVDFNGVRTPTDRPGSPRWNRKVIAYVYCRSVGCRYTVEDFSVCDGELSLDDEDRWAAWGNPGACAGTSGSWSLTVGRTQTGHATISSDSHPPIAWMDTLRALYFDGDAIKQLDMSQTPWSSSTVIAHADDFRYSAAARRIYFTRKGDGLYALDF